MEINLNNIKLLKTEFKNYSEINKKYIEACSLVQK